MKKYLLDLKVKFVEQIHQRYVLIKLTDDQPLPEMLPGQFVEIRVDGSPSTFLRRPDEKILLVGGGVGVAPLLYMGAEMAKKGMEPTFLLGARTSKDLLMLDIFKRYGRVCVTTEDGSEGEKGFVTNHSLLQTEQFTRIATCGPTPMMKAVAEFARKTDVECEVSLENLMACGLGACLCCVEKTTEGNLCVCKDGPVFNIRKLLWQV